MTDEKILLEALSSSDFKVSIHDKKRVDAEEVKTAVENKQQHGEDPHLEAAKGRLEEKGSLLSIVTGMSAEQRKKVIETLKQNGLNDPWTKEKLVQNAFTVERTVRESA